MAHSQIQVLLASDAQTDCAQGIVTELRARQVQLELEFSNDKLTGRIQRAEEKRAYHTLVVGQKEQDANAIALRIHGKGPQGVKPRNEVVAEI